MWCIESNPDRSRVKLTFANVLSKNTRGWRQAIDSQIYVLRMCPVFNIEKKKKVQYVLYGVRQSVSEGDFLTHWYCHVAIVHIHKLCVCVCVLQYSICSPCGERRVQKFSQESTRYVWIINNLFTSTEFWEGASVTSIVVSLLSCPQSRLSSVPCWCPSSVFCFSLFLWLICLY